jgi:glycosyltransferase involved in cell wall biosynthesis
VRGNPVRIPSERLHAIPSVLMLLNTTGIEYDDRVRKESATLLAAGANPEILVIETSNRAALGTTEAGVGYRALPLLTRRLLPRQRGLILKALEMYGRFAWHVVLRRPRTLWLHDTYLAGFVPIAALLRRLRVIRRIVWDQHELPSERVLGSAWRMRALELLGRLCDVIVVASQSRKEYLADRMGSWSSRMASLENYPDHRFAALPREPLPERVSMWLEGRPYFVAQGGAAPVRRFEELVGAVMKLEGVACVVIGPVVPASLDRLDQRHGDIWRKRVYFTGFLPQMELHPIVDHALASVVLYARVSENNWNCAPNRLFQAIVRGVPVLAGANPPMARVIERHGCGVVLGTDGSDVDELASAMSSFLVERGRFRSEAAVAGRNLLWESQTPILLEILANGQDHPDPMREPAQPSSGVSLTAGNATACIRMGTQE